jgi:hypothetical protein
MLDKATRGEKEVLHSYLTHTSSRHHRDRVGSDKHSHLSSSNPSHTDLTILSMKQLASSFLPGVKGRLGMLTFRPDGGSTDPRH